MQHILLVQVQAGGGGGGGGATQDPLLHTRPFTLQLVHEDPHEVSEFAVQVVLDPQELEPVLQETPHEVPLQAGRPFAAGAGQAELQSEPQLFKS